MNKELKKLDKLFWFFPKKGTSLDEDKDKNMIIHQTLALGNMNDLKELFSVYGEETIREEFQKPAKGMYSSAVLELVQFLLKVRIKNKSPYIKNIYGKIAPGNLG